MSQENSSQKFVSVFNLGMILPVFAAVALRSDFAVEDRRSEGRLVMVVTAIVSGWEILRYFCRRACDAVNMQVHF